MIRRTVVRLGAALATAAAAAVAAGAASAGAPGNAYTVTPLQTDATDANLVNAWGLVSSATSPWWVADNGTGRSTLYNGAGAKLALVVDTKSSAPTGTVFNTAGTGFPVGAASARFIFDGEDGVITGWAGGPVATVEVADPNAEFKGLAYAVGASGPRLYATDFATQSVDVYDSSWSKVTTAGGFVDASLPSDYAPFGIQAIGDRVFVTYAPKEPGGTDEVAGQGHGIVDAYDLDGRLLARVAQHGRLDAPWGLALAPAGFGRFGGDLLVGNFGDGTINAYEELPNGHFEHRGQLRGADSAPVTIDGLWALQFGHGNANSGPTDTLYFTAGPNDESAGLFGTITSG